MRQALDDGDSEVTARSLPELAALVDRAMAARMASDWNTPRKVLPPLVAESAAAAEGGSEQTVLLHS